MRSRSPFASLKQEIRPVVTMPDGAIVYFVSTGSIDPNTSPVSIQEKQRKQARINALILEAIETLAVRQGITSEQARSLIFPDDKEKGTAIEVNPLSYLNLEQKTEYFGLTAEAAELPLLAATLMMRFRVAYDLTLLEPVEGKARKLYVREPWYEISVGAVFKFDQLKVSITEPYDAEDGSIGIAQIDTVLPVGAAGFLLNSDRKTYAMGDPFWTIEHTKELSLENADGSDSQIQSIYNFYLRESGQFVEPKLETLTDKPQLEGSEEEPKREGKSQSKSKILKPTTDQPALTGMTSSVESTPTESETNGLPITRTLETAPIG
ncbi:MAG: hypothetical protein KME42_14065 [Tildeniella nuda ZEHNDER 1965/U140]|jgi:hypothetical protein|nr:hypothetical protein [Tildeniella nuda ZEHNDER 1965/U140]